MVAWWCLRGTGAMPLEVLAWVSAAATGVAMALLYIALRSHAEPLPALVVALTVGVCFSPWAYATAPEVYPLVAVALCGLCAAWLWSGWRWAAALGVLAGLLVACHLLMALVVLGFAADAAWRRRWRCLAPFSVATAGTFLLAAGGSMLLLGATPQMAVQRVQEHLAANPPSVAAPDAMVRRFSLLVLGGVDPSAELIPLDQQTTLLRGLATAAFLLLLAGLGVRNERTRGPVLGAVALVLGVLVLDPGSETLYLVLPLLAVTVGPWPGWSWLVLVVVAFQLGSRNLQATTVAASPEVNPRYLHAHALAGCLGPDDILVVRPGLETMYLRYFTPGPTIFVDPGWPGWVDIARGRMAEAPGPLYAPGSLWTNDDQWLEDPAALPLLLEGWDRVEVPCSVLLYRLVSSGVER